MERTYIYSQTYNIASKHGLDRSKVTEIVSLYLEYTRNKLMTGNAIDFLDILSVVPDKTYTAYKSTLAYDCMILANKIGIPYITFYTIIRGYLEDIKNNLFDNKVVNIRGIVTLQPIRKNGKLVSVYSNISQSISQALPNQYISSVRVHTSKLLRKEIKDKDIVIDNDVSSEVDVND